VGDEVEAKFTAVDRKVRTIALSIKAKEMSEEAEAVSQYRSDSSTGTSLGDLLKSRFPASEAGAAAAGRLIRRRRRFLKRWTDPGRSAVDGERSMTKSELIELIAAKQSHLLPRTSNWPSSRSSRS